jgi:hypothetical protein
MCEVTTTTLVQLTERLEAAIARGPCEGPRAKVYEIMIDAVERGVERGWRRAHKHSPPAPAGSVICAEIERAVCDALCEVFEW